MCGPLHGIEPDYLGIVTRAKRYTDKLEGRVTENAKVLGKLLEETPEPFISGKDKNGRPVTDKDLDYFIADLDYFVEVDDDGNEESETLDEEDEHNSDYELPPLGAPTVEGTLLIIAAYEALVQLRKALKIRRGRSLGSKPLLIALAYIEST
ncbi:hypothetical protein Forpe1208_v005196 [Fusarium oxysporum f. sp. rapae]|uniref:Uncharacterized protein n=1 Tax=Fusarium oxysporum f. sp. rapae TaxID=485398 RepID=A0A8J5UDY8_FUSOX|nr:hypothetical protein Forpe1208_v005196 [Fusarium oxysporum f. sp. rapae]